MDLQLGQKVAASDGTVGDLANIVLDPTTMRVTHLVVDPPLRHRLARLVPVAKLVDQTDGTLELNITRQEFKQLQFVSYSALVNLGSDVEATGDWSTGNQDVWGMPYWAAKLEFTTEVDHVVVAYHRIPKGDCEIRRSSDVMSSDSVSVGSVAGLSTEGEEIAGVIVRSDNRRTLLPIQSVIAVENDCITIAETKSEFEALPSIKATSALSRFFARPPERRREPFRPL